MKKITSFILFCIIPLTVLAQEKFTTSDKSVIKHISFQKNSSENYIKALPIFQMVDFLFLDENNDQVIEAEERSVIRFNLLNVGNGKAQDVTLAVSLKHPDVTGLVYDKEIDLGEIYSMNGKQVSIAVSGKPELVNGVAEFRIDILDQDKTNPDPIELEIPTKRFAPPHVIIANHAFYTDSTAQTELGETIYFKTLVQNIGKGTASQVQAEFVLPSSPLRSNNIYHIGQLSSGESIEVKFPFIITRDYGLNQFNIAVKLSEKYNLYSENKTIAMDLLKSLPRKEVNLTPQEVTDEAVVETTDKKLPDVDVNIPKHLVKYSNRLALVIGNQDYQFIPPLGEQNTHQVLDALVFKEYLIRVLGLKEDNIYLLTNTTSDNLIHHAQLMSRIASRVGNAELFIYFSGLAFFDPGSYTPYLLPVDTRGEQKTPNQNLFDLFQLFNQTGSDKIHFFLDATMITPEEYSIEDKMAYHKKVNQQLGENMVLYAATAPGQTAFPYPEGSHGLFTYYLLKHLKDTKGKTSSAALGDFLSKNVSLESLKIFEKNQTPEIFIGNQAFSRWRHTRFIEF